MPATAATRDRRLALWGRRALSLPLYGALFVLVDGGLPIWLGLALAVDLLARDLRLPRVRAVVFFGWYLCCEIWGVAGAFATWVWSLGDDQRLLASGALLQRWWTGALFAGARVIYGMTVEVEGQSLGRPGPILLFIRHTSTADSVLAAAMVANPNRILLRYVAKRELLWDPCLDLIGRRLPNVFVDRSGSRSETEIAAVAGLARGLDAHSGVLIYPEGTRYSRAKHDRALEKLRAQGREDLARLAEAYQHVLPPKLGGPLALLEAAPGVDVVILEHTGFEGAASFRDFVGGAFIGGRLAIRLRRVAASAIPAAGRDLWLFERWAEVDAWVGQQQAIGGGSRARRRA